MREVLTQPPSLFRRATTRPRTRTRSSNILRGPLAPPGDVTGGRSSVRHGRAEVQRQASPYEHPDPRDPASRNFSEDMRLAQSGRV